MNEKSAIVFRHLRDEREYIDELQSQITEIENFIIGVGSSLKNTNGASASAKDYDARKIEGICKLDKVRELLVGRIDEYSKIRANVTATLLNIETPSARRALLLYYFPKTVKDEGEDLFRTWDEVAEIMHCDTKTAQNYRDIGFEEFEKLYFENT